ncbi:hypothetical protein CF392_07585 [Tamilnaduibacter salinus]|uniref:Sulfotransferase family protein n=1 Tax=Tamilnaduibacter salinus TaxID=1484056 RepID=A0A2A2I472_9GAMM|nr:sulfotransferase family 2 domain-containing protein [Tamilnaduibacter salinus]PAV26084.1 hypothetical protein CF392_07585 [Tamilnaduibacter salinus]
MTDAVPEARQNRKKTVAGALYFPLQARISIEQEVSLCRFYPFKHIARRMRDPVVNHRQRLIYFPIPKSACTTFTTFLAITDPDVLGFNSQTEGIHTFRNRTKSIRLNNFRLLLSDEYHRFTVIRRPYERLLSAYLDKIVKPKRSRAVMVTEKDDPSFQDLVYWIYTVPDHRIEEHFRPQTTFIRHVPFDHIGLFDDLESTFRWLEQRTSINPEQLLENRIHSPKRTKYGESQPVKTPPYAMKASELASLASFPASEQFFADHLASLVNRRFEQDLKLYNVVKEASQAS